VVTLVSDLIRRTAPNAVVIACNTASTLVLPPLRSLFGLPFVGTVPAIKPAAERTKSGLVSVLATYGTMRRDYTRELIDRFAKSCHVRLVGSANLARFAEARMRGEPVSDPAIFGEISPAFMEQDGRRTDVIVLACTHYPFLINNFRDVAPWPVEWIDPAAAIARRVAAVAGPAPSDRPVPGRAYLTSGRAWPPPLADFLAQMNLRPCAGEI
jgi:glutamate racemase